MIEQHFDLKEDQSYLYLVYKVGPNNMTLIYDKDKDVILLLNNGQVQEVSSLKENETERYREILDIAICYHHDRDNETLH